MPRTRRIACSTGARDLPPARVAVSPVHRLPLGPGALHDHRSRCLRHATRSARDAQATTRATHPRCPAAGNEVMVKVFVVVPFLALLGALPFAWGWGLTVVDGALAAAFYLVTLTGITVGYHRHFTHRSFKATRPVRITLAALGSMALQGPVISW